jgi:hypothetical protein
MTSIITQSLFAATMLFSSDFVVGQTDQFIGSWTKEGTTYQFDFILILNHVGDGQVEGQFRWTVAKPDEKAPQSVLWYQHKIGLQATEFVKGRYNDNTKELFIEGYRKDDPHMIIALDEYRLKVIGDHTLQGTSKAHGTWEGIIDGTRSVDNAL